MLKNTLQAGFARVNITPPLGIHISGYFVERIADGVLDELEAVALAVGDGKETAVLITMDTLGASKDILTPVREEIARLEQRLAAMQAELDALKKEKEKTE